MRRGGIQGFILADVLIAVFVLSVGVLAVAGLFMQVGQAARSLAHQEQASCLAAEALEGLRHWGTLEWTAENLADAAGSARVEKDGVVYDRIIALRPRPDLDPQGHLLEAEVRVDWVEQARPRRLVMVTYFAVGTDLDGLR
jgi:hypothetical protein